MNFWIQQNTLFYNVIIVQLNTVRHRTSRTHSSALKNLQDGCSVERIYTSLYSNLVRDEVDNVLTKSWVNALFTVLIGLLNCLTICDWPGSVQVKLSSLGIIFFVWQPFWSINWLKYSVCAVLLKHSDSKEMASSLFAGRLILLSVVCAHLSSIRSFLSPEPLGLVTTNRWQHKHNDGQSSNKHDHAGVSLNPSRRVNKQFP